MCAVAPAVARADVTRAGPDPLFRHEGEMRLGIGAGTSVLDVADKSTVDFGAGSGLDFGYVLTDAFDLIVELSSSLVAKNAPATRDEPHTRPAGVDTYAAGAVYVLDVTRLSPYGGLLLGATTMEGGTLDHMIAAMTIQLALGVDYRAFRHFSFGLALRQQMNLIPASRATDYPSFTQTFLRVEYVWGP